MHGVTPEVPEEVAVLSSTVVSTPPRRAAARAASFQQDRAPTMQQPVAAEVIT